MPFSLAALGTVSEAHSRNPAEPADPDRHRRCFPHIALRVDPRHVGLVVAEEDLGLFEAEVLADAGTVGVAELVGGPAAGIAPATQRGLSLLGQAVSPGGDGLAVLLGQGAGGERARSQARRMAMR